MSSNVAPDNSGSDIVIEIADVWKIFGDNADEAFKAIKAEGLSKAQVLEQYNCVVGVADVTSMSGVAKFSVLWDCPVAASPHWYDTSIGCLNPDCRSDTH